MKSETIVNLPAKEIFTIMAYRRNLFISLTVLCLIFFFLFQGFSLAATCGNPGNDGVGTPSGVVNTYYPGTASVSAGSTSIPVGSPSGSGPAIADGDLLLIIQMQDADINYSNDSNYGSGSGTGSGYTNLNQTGYYEFAVAAGAVSGGFVSIKSGLTYSYRYRAASGTNGQSRYQVIRVPQYSSATVSGTVSALPWDGNVGGLVVMDVTGTLTINGTVTANGAGFRGGYGRTLAGAAGRTNTEYRTSYLVNTNGSKGEGIAGTPYYMNRPAAFNGAPVQITGGSGYPDGTNANYSYARGAPGNAGGGATDGNPPANDQNSGGGGGGNYAPGAKGGNSWNSNLTVGGEGGSGLSSVLAFNRVVMGGGGGAGSTNNGTADNATYANNAALACSLTTGACSSGAPGGGIIILRANYINGSGTISANGGHAYNVQNDAGGGGGAGGTIVIYTYEGGSATASVNGGDGGNAWRTQDGTTYPGNRHGPGGGGGGGFIAYSPSSLSISMSYSSGVSGSTTTANDSYGSTSTTGGYSTFDAPVPPGVEPSADCVPRLSTSTKKWVDRNGGDQNPGDVIRYTITLTETNGIAASNVTVTDNIPANVNSFTVVSIPAGATDSSDPGGGTNGTGYLNITGISVPASGSVTIVFDVTINNPLAAGTLINNSATVTPPTGFGATPAAPTITVSGGSVPGTGNKPLYIYRDSATTGHINRTPATVNAASYVNIAEVTTVSFALSPVLQSSVTVSSGNIPVRLWLTATSTRTYTIPITLRCGANTIATASPTISLTAVTPPSTPSALNVNLPLAAAYTCAPGNNLILDVRNNQTGSGTRDIQVYPAPSTGNYSYVNPNSQNVINVDSIGFYTAAYSGGTVLTAIAPGQTVYVRAIVSDPFGAYDVSGATLTMTDSGGVVRLTAGAMTENTGYSSPSGKMYEYAYTPALGSATGYWTARVDAAEGTEGLVTDYASAAILVAQPSLTIVKSANTNPVTPGQTVTYTILITNTGAGNAINATVTDPLPQYTTYVANSTRLNSITVAGDGTTLPLIGGLLIDNNASRSPGAAATGILPAGTSATVTFQVTIN